MRLGLGTAQFGLDYGVSNSTGRCSESEVARILALANRSKIKILDTAPAYGESEAVLGRCGVREGDYRIVTKTARMQGVRYHCNGVTTIRDVFLRSLERLGQPAIYGLLVHSCRELFGPDGNRYCELLNTLKAEGLIEKLGISVYEEAEITEARRFLDFDLLQAPVNVFDQRLIHSGQLSRLKQAGIEIHCRSAFLQGLLLMTPDRVPPYFEPFGPLLRDYRTSIEAAGLSPVVAALAFLRGCPEIDCILVGVTSARELREVICAYHTKCSPDINFRRFATSDIRIVNPGFWQLP